jgi:hypothetical protein
VRVPLRTATVCLLLFGMAFVVFRVSPRGQLYDSKYALLISHQLASRGTLDLGDLARRAEGVGAEQPLSYRFVERNGRVDPFFPVGTPVLAAPLVAAAGLAGLSVVDAEGRYHPGIERSLQRSLAALAMAALSVLFFATARLVLPCRASLWIAFAGAFGTQVWSTASRSLWSHGLAIALLAGALHLILRARVSDRPLPAASVAGLLAWAWLCRPTLALSIAAIAVYVAWTARSALPRLLLAGSLWAALFMTLFWLDTGSPLPPYYAGAELGWERFPVAFAGHMISPSRGLLIYCPLVLGVAHLLWKHWAGLPQRPLVVAGIAVFFAHWLLISAFAHWWGGYGYGARLMTDVVPWIVLLGAIGLSAALAAGPGALNALERRVMGALVVASIAINGIGAISKGAAEWNEAQQRPGFEQKLWDWRDPQWLHRPARAGAAE